MGAHWCWKVLICTAEEERSLLGRDGSGRLSSPLMGRPCVPPHTSQGGGEGASFNCWVGKSTSGHKHQVEGRGRKAGRAAPRPLLQNSSYFMAD